MNDTTTIMYDAQD